ncbi:MAG: hypothetical protein Q9163_003049 [Psora crenata]
MAPKEEEKHYQPKDAVGHGVTTTLIMGGVGLTVSAIQNTLTRQNVGAWGVFTRTGGAITLFASMGATYGFSKTAAANLREKDDSWNPAIAGFLAGSIAGLRMRSFPATLGYGAGLAVLQGVFDYTGGKFTGYDRDPNVNEYERKELLRREKRRPIQETLNELGEGRVLQGRVDNLRNTAMTPAERAAVLEQCQRGVQSLTSEVKMVASSLPAHDQRTYSMAIKDLTEAVQKARKAYAPKRKFEFKSPIQRAVNNTEASTGPISKIDATEEAPLPHPKDSTDSLSYKRSATGAPQQSTDIPSNPAIVPQQLPDASSLVTTISLLSNEVYILPPEPPMTSSAILTHIDHSLVDLSATTRADRPFSTIADNAGTEAPNLWDQVDDFKWLKAGHSPNWEVLQPDDERAIKDDAWDAIANDSESRSRFDTVLMLAKIASD